MIILQSAELPLHHLQHFLPLQTCLPLCAAWQQLLCKGPSVCRTCPRLLQTDKRFQLADWRVRPLSPQMLQYARTDTHYLLHIYDVCKVSWQGLLICRC